MNFNLGWYVLYVKSRFEKIVHESLKDSSIESFLPRIKTIQHWSDRKKIVLKPLFPSYLFVNIKSASAFNKALSVRGACTYIRFGKEYAKVTEREIDNIKILIGLEGLEDIGTHPQLPKVGEVRKIVHGPLNNLECEILRVNNYKKIIVRVESLRQNIIATVPLHYFEYVK